MRSIPRAVLVLGALVLVLAFGAPADAHRNNLQSNLMRFDGVTTPGYIEMKPRFDGSVHLELPSHPLNGRLVVDYRVNGEPFPNYAYPLVSDDHTYRLGLVTEDQDMLEIRNIRVEDEAGNPVAVLGAEADIRGSRVFSSPLVWVADTHSDVAFVRGADTELKPGGQWMVGLDHLRSRATGRRLTNKGNYAEIEIKVNDGAWQVYSITFDIRSGKSLPQGRPYTLLPIQPGDRIQIGRLDVFDPAGNMFATVGIRMGVQGHSGKVPPPAPTPDPTP